MGHGSERAGVQLHHVVGRCEAVVEEGQLDQERAEYQDMVEGRGRDPRSTPQSKVPTDKLRVYLAVYGRPTHQTPSLGELAFCLNLSQLFGYFAKSSYAEYRTRNFSGDQTNLDTLLEPLSAAFYDPKILCQSFT